MTDRRPPSDDELFDARLRAAASRLAEEPLPEGILDVAQPHVPFWRRPGPMLLAASAGALAVVVWIAATQVGPQRIAESSPTADPTASASVVPQPTAVPTVAPSPSAIADPAEPPFHLVTAGSACADGAAGFSFMVPDGWFANRAAYGEPACRFVDDVPFSAPFFDTAITVAVRDSEVPSPGQPTEVGRDIPTSSADRFATRYRVVRSDETMITYVVPLLASGEGPPTYLHLEAEASDEDAMDALAAIVARVEVREPLMTPADAVAQADELFAESELDGCVNTELGIITAFPEAWWTNTPFEDVPGCVYLAPASFEIPQDQTQVPDGVAITIQRFDGDVGSFEAITGYETLVVDRWPAVRVEHADTSYRYVVQLGPTSEEGPNLVLATGSDPLHRAVLDRVAATLRISPPPPEVVARDPLPACGVEIQRELASNVGRNPEARECFADAYAAGEPAEFIQLGLTLEGTNFLSIWRVLGPQSVELYADSTHDHLGDMAWQLYRCTSLDVLADAEGTPSFGIGACDSPVQLEAGQ